MPYMVTYTINIHQMLAYIPAPWILWVNGPCYSLFNPMSLLLVPRHPPTRLCQASVDIMRPHVG